MTELKYKVGDKVWVPVAIDEAEGASLYGIENEEFGLDCWVSKQLEKVAIPLPVIPRFVADWIEEIRGRGLLLSGIFTNENKKVVDWWSHSEERTRDIVLAWLFGYEVEQEKVYKVIIPKVKKCRACLIYNIGERKWYFKAYNAKGGKFRIHHTRKELEDAGLGWVFEQGFAVEVEE